MSSKAVRKFKYNTMDFIKWMDAYAEVNPAIAYFGTYGLNTSVNVGILAFIYYKDLVGLNALGFGLFSLPIMYHLGYEYQGIVKSMAIPRICATVGSLLYYYYRLTVDNDKGDLLFGLIKYKNKITIENNKYLYGYCLFSTIVWSISGIFDIGNIYEWFIQKDRKVLRDKKTLDELKEMGYIDENVEQYQWLYRKGEKVNKDIDEYGFIINI